VARQPISLAEARKLDLETAVLMQVQLLLFLALFKIITVAHKKW
jgi:hypothetical protein